MGWLGLSYEEHHKDVERFVSKISLQSNSQEDLFAVIYCYMCSTGNPLNARTLKELSHAACQSISKQSIKSIADKIKFIHKQLTDRISTPTTIQDILPHFCEKLNISSDVTSLAMSIAHRGSFEACGHLFDTAAMSIVCLVSHFLGKRLDLEDAARACFITTQTLGLAISKMAKSVTSLAHTLHQHVHASQDERSLLHRPQHSGGNMWDASDVYERTGAEARGVAPAGILEAVPMGLERGGREACKRTQGREADHDDPGQPHRDAELRPSKKHRPLEPAAAPAVDAAPAPVLRARACPPVTPAIPLARDAMTAAIDLEAKQDRARLAARAIRLASREKQEHKAVYMAIDSLPPTEVYVDADGKESVVLD